MMTKQITQLILICGLTMAAFSISAQNSQNDILGEWFTADEGSIVKIYKQGDKYYGDISWIKEPYNEEGELKRDGYNPDPELRDRPIEGIRLLSGFEWDDGEWDDGEVYNPRDGKTFDAIIELEDENTLILTGYVGFSFIGKSVEWKRKLD